MVSVFVSRGCYAKLPQTWRLGATELYDCRSLQEVPTGAVLPPEAPGEGPVLPSSSFQ